jgi:hypothetical protein
MLERTVRSKFGEKVPHMTCNYRQRGRSTISHLFSHVSLLSFLTVSSVPETNNAGRDVVKIEPNTIAYPDHTLFYCGVPKHRGLGRPRIARVYGRIRPFFKISKPVFLVKNVQWWLQIFAWLRTAHDRGRAHSLHAMCYFNTKNLSHISSAFERFWDARR